MNYYEQQKQETNQFIIKALFELMEVKPFHSISVSELCRQAEIGRKTFYRHFESTHQVLEEYFHQLCIQYISSTTPLKEYQFESICREFFHFWEPYRPQLKRIQNSLGMGYVSSAILRNAHHVVHYRSGCISPRFTVYSTSGLCGLLEEWLQDEDPIPAIQLAKEISSEFYSLQQTGRPCML